MFKDRLHIQDIFEIFKKEHKVEINLNKFLIFSEILHQINFDFLALILIYC